jgi:outer membrane protein OmpA-like peptidoglycan-associated protein
MKRHATNDHLSSSLTDLMTSLMVIFILLLVAKLNNQATGTGRSIDYVMKQLETTELFKEGETIRKDGDVIVIVVPQQLMSFKQATAEHGGADLSPQGRAYLRENVPRLANVLCGAAVRKHIDTIVVEGHSDKTGWGSGDARTDQEENLKLSQRRSMAVVSESMNILGDSRGCFLDLLSATGRGDAHPIDAVNLSSPENRRVEFRIRVRPDAALSLADAVNGGVQK